MIDEHFDDIPAIPPGVRLVTYPNGLTLILKEDHSAPVVSAQAWCKAGSIHEGKWLGAGLSHVLEHMLFKGTANRAGGRIDQEVQEAGGYMNAYTSFDRTVYWINAPSTGTRVVIDILADIVQNATLPEDELEKEKQVILREMDMNQDDPRRRASRRLFETAYTRSPYRFSIIGYPDIFHEITRQDVVDYYKRNYVPNNIFFVVVGDVNGEEVVKQLEETVGKAKARALDLAVLPEEPRQTGPREVIEEAAIELSHFHYSWHIPDLQHPDIPSLDVLSTLLGGGRSSRLYQELRQKKGVVSSIDAWTYSPGNPGLFGVSVMTPGEKFDIARKEVTAQIDRLKSGEILLEELGKVVKQFTASTLATRKTMQGQAQDLGVNWIATSDLSFSDRYLAAVKRLNRQTLKRVAEQYLDRNNSTLYGLVPEGTVEQKVKQKIAAVSSSIEKIEFPNGLRLLVKEDHRLPFVEIRTVFRGGVLVEEKSNNGISQLTSKMLLQGTRKRSGEQIVSEIEAVGGSIDTFGGNNSLGVNVEVLKDDLTTALEVLSDILLNSQFPEDALTREREIQLNALSAQKDQMLQTAARLMRRGLFGEKTYGLDALGNEEAVLGLDREKIRAFQKRLMHPKNCVMAVFGAVSAKEITRLINLYFETWQQGADIPEPSETQQAPVIPRLTEFKDKKQAVLMIGFRGINVHNEDRFAMEILQESCSDLGSRLFLRIREQLGLAYYVGAQHVLGLSPGFFAFYAGTMPEKLELVEKEILKEIALLREEGLSEEELKRSKAKILGQKKIARQDLGSHALTAALDELYGLGYASSDKDDEKYEKLTLEQVKKVAAKYLVPDRMVIASVAPEG